ncbi:hypothetical protein J2Y73_005061 [Peribacillus frigoritolerans]|uniref:hypothetical protein n=1 Tax=Peribacillus frigoritolerans TaxID=450367 RepID=UPI0020A1A6CA|nr:hypothetical protein [Peribacillus frigoritolerans]MCP1495030.1 hypothetical protein [Peribacillus frigoritolerans]
MFFPVILIGWKKFATLLPNNWLAKTPQPLAVRRLGRQSAERERISEINWNLFKEKTAGKRVSLLDIAGYAFRNTLFCRLLLYCVRLY